MSQPNSDPMDFLRSMWGGKTFSLPGMVTPTLDTEELDKRIKDLKTVEGWLRTNLTMLQMTIQNLEMQSTTITAVKTMSQLYSEQTASGETASDATDGLAQTALWPWTMMQQMQEKMQSAAASTTTASEDTKTSASSPKTRKRPS